ncbi:MAG: hypothetical protein R3F60_13725 [bacterium]
MKRWVAALIVAMFGCDDGGGGGAGGAGGGTVDAAGGGGGGGMVVDLGPGDAAVGDMGAGGMGGAGGEMPMETPIDERCPEAQAGTYLLVFYPDRVDAYRQREFGASYFCEFLDLKGNGITTATGVAQRLDGSFLVSVPEEGRGAVYQFTGNGEFDRRVESNVNLAGIAGIWNTFGDDFVVWSAANQNLYKLSEAGQFRGPWEPPQYQGARVPGITDMTFLDTDAVVMTFRDRPAQLFMFPDAPSFPANLVGPGNSTIAVQTDEGPKVLMSAQIGGEGNGFGVVLFKPIRAGRAAAIEQESVLIPASEIVDGIDLLALGSGFLVLDSALAGSAKISGYDAMGMLREETPIMRPGNPIGFARVAIFPDF